MSKNLWEMLISSSTNSGIKKDSSFAAIHAKEMAQMLTFKKLEPTHLWQFSDWNDQATIEAVGDNYFFDRLIA